VYRVEGGYVAQAFLAAGREASGFAVRDLMMVCRRVTGWLSPYRYEERFEWGFGFAVTSSLHL
jgi:hypothetical protein